MRCTFYDEAFLQKVYGFYSLTIFAKKLLQEKSHMEQTAHHKDVYRVSGKNPSGKNPPEKIPPRPGKNLPILIFFASVFVIFLS